eukprot:2005628-Prymnesium_polylepis.1
MYKNPCIGTTLHTRRITPARIPTTLGVANPPARATKKPPNGPVPAAALASRRERERLRQLVATARRHPINRPDRAPHLVGAITRFHSGKTSAVIESIAT